MVVCDKCSQEFKIEVKKRKVKDDIIEEYMRCPNCKKDYNIMYTNNKTRLLRKEVQKKLRLYRTKTSNRNKNRYYKVKRELENLTDKLYSELKLDKK